MQDISCKKCGQTFKSQTALQEHTERTHGGGKMGGDTTGMGGEGKQPRR